MVEGPSSDFKLDREIGWRIDRRTGTAVWVHPYRVGLPVGHYVPASQPLPEATQPRPVPSAAALVMPEDATDLEGWLVAVLRLAEPEELFEVIGRAEQAAAAHLTPEVVTQAPAPDSVSRTGSP